MSLKEESKEVGIVLPLDEQLDKAVLIASKVHWGQKDKQGVNYILHPIAVMMAAETMEEKILALLHDVIEDGDVSLEDLKKEGFSPVILEALDHISRREEEEYCRYLVRVKEDPLALKIKFLDIKHNLRQGCPLHLRIRYEKALEFLRED